MLFSVSFHDFIFKAEITICPLKGRGQRMDVLIEMRTQLRFRDAANGGVRLSHGYIVQIVEVAEDAYLPELDG